MYNGFWATTRSIIPCIRSYPSRNARRSTGHPVCHERGTGTHQIIEHVRVKIAAATALVLVFQSGVGDEFRAAGPFGQKLHPAGALELDGDPDRLLDAAAGRDDAVVAQDQGDVRPKVVRHLLAALRRDDEVAGLGKDRQLLVEIARLVVHRYEFLAERRERYRMRRMGVDDTLNVRARA